MTVAAVRSLVRRVARGARPAHQGHPRAPRSRQRLLYRATSRKSRSKRSASR
jgi:hypothetical protein